jgi:hypothetical protein
MWTLHRETVSQAVGASDCGVSVGFNRKRAERADLTETVSFVRM